MDSKSFYEQLEKFKELSLIDKEKIILKRLKVLSATSKMYCDSIKAENDIIVNKDLVDVKGEEFSSDDFVEAVYTLLYSIENSIFTFHKTNTKLLADLLLNEKDN